MPFLSPNQQCQSTEVKISHSMDLLAPSSPGGLQTLSLTTNKIAAGYLGPCHASHQTSDASTQLCIRQLSQALSVLSQPRFLSNDVCVVLLTRDSFLGCVIYLLVIDWKYTSPKWPIMC